MTTTGATAVTPAIFLSPQPPQISMSPLELDGYLTGIIVTPQAVSIRPSAWIAQLWGDDAPIFEDEAQIGAVLGAVMIHYNTLLRDIDRSLKRMEADRIVDYRPCSCRATKSRHTRPCAHGSAASGRRWRLPPRPGVRSWRTSGPT